MATCGLNERYHYSSGYNYYIYESNYDRFVLVIDDINKDKSGVIRFIYVIVIPRAVVVSGKRWKKIPLQRGDLMTVFSRNIVAGFAVTLVVIIGYISHISQVEKHVWLYPTSERIFNFNMSIKRPPKVYAETLDKTNDWYTAFLEITEDLSENVPEYVCKYKNKIANWFNCNTYPFLINKDCLVYSFGINYDWRFDDAMAMLGCEVHSFDPSMGKMAEHIRAPSGVHFHPIGLTGGTESSSFKPQKDEYTAKFPNKTWEVKTLRTIMKKLGHNGRHIDILKMDIENYEWDVMKNILNDGLAKKIRQLNIEFHIFKNTPNTNLVPYLEIYQNLKRFGFRRFAGGIDRPMLHKSKEGRQVLAEQGFVNLKFDFGRYPLD